jgi:hypothetical protein
MGFPIPEDGVLHSHRRGNVKPYIALTGWAQILHSHRRENLKSDIDIILFLTTNFIR